MEGWKLSSQRLGDEDSELSSSSSDDEEDKSHAWLGLYRTSDRHNDFKYSSATDDDSSDGTGAKPCGWNPLLQGDAHESC